MPNKPKKTKKEISQAVIDELIRKYKGRHAVESDCLKSCLNPKYSRYLFVGLDEGVLYLNLEAMVSKMLPSKQQDRKKLAGTASVCSEASGGQAREVKGRERDEVSGDRSFPPRSAVSGRSESGGLLFWET